MAERGATGIEVTTGFFPLAFFLFFCTPRIEIDGAVVERPWGTHFFASPPGTHVVKVYFPYLFMPQCGANSISVNVPPGQLVRIKYWMPPLMFVAGSIKQV